MLCSPASSVLWRDPTPHRRSCWGCGLGLSQPDFLCFAQSGLSRSGLRSPGSRACSFFACMGSTTTWDPRRTRVYARLGVAFPLCTQGRHPRFVSRSSIPSPQVPLFTLRLPPHDDTRKTPGQGGSLLLSCKTLSFSTTCRFIPATSSGAPPSPVAASCQNSLPSFPVVTWRLAAVA